MKKISPECSLVTRFAFVFFAARVVLLQEAEGGISVVRSMNQGDLSCLTT
jgi:hypothetical protein